MGCVYVRECVRTGRGRGGEGNLFAGWVRAGVSLGGEDDGDSVTLFEVDGSNGIKMVMSASLE